MSMTNYKSWFIFKNLLLVVFLGFFMESATIAQEQNELFSYSKNSQENTLNETIGDLLDNESVKVPDYLEQNDIFKIQHQFGSAFLANSLPSYFKKPDFLYSFLSQAP